MGRHVWSDDVKAKALVLIADPELSYYDVHKATGVPASTLHDWASAAGLVGHSDRLAETEAARKFRTERIAVKRAVVAEKLLDYAEQLADRSAEISDGMVEVKEGVFVPTGRDSLAFMNAAQAALTLHRLEMGEATAVTENRTTEVAVVAKQKLDELAQRRQSKSA